MCAGVCECVYLCVLYVYIHIYVCVVCMLYVCMGVYVCGV